MNTRTKKLSTLCAALGGAGLARTGAMLALALGAAQAGAVTYTVPLQFNITLAPPVCSLTVGDQVVNGTGTTGVNPIVNLTAAGDLPVINSPVALLGLLNSVSEQILGTAAGVWFDGNFGAQQRRINVANTPTASANCTLGTPMVAKVARVLGTSTPGTGWLSGHLLPVHATNAQAPTPLLGMLMGISRFGAQAGLLGSAGGTTANGVVPTVSITADGTNQDIVLAAALYTQPTNTTPLTGSSAGTWSYNFNVSLDF
jgi:type 1 fimbria pilin